MDTAAWAASPSAPSEISPRWTWSTSMKPADAACAAHLTEFDGVHGRWPHDCRAEDGAVLIDGQRITYSSTKNPADIPWRDMGVDIVMDATGKHKTPEAYRAFIVAGITAFTPPHPDT